MAVCSSGLMCFYQMITSLLYIKQDAKKISITSMGVGITQIIIQLTLVLLLPDKAFAMILSQLICAVIMFLIFALYSKSYIRLTFDTNKIWIYLKYALCLIPSDISSWLMGLSDRMMMNKMKGSALTGVYGMGQTLGNIPKIAFYSINKAYVPFVLNSYKEIESGNEDQRRNLIRHTTLVFCLITVIVTLLICFTKDIIGLLDNRYSDAAIVMAIMLTSMLIDCYRTIFMTPLTYNLKYTKVNSIIWMASAVLSFSMNLYLIPRYSIYGACFTMIFTYAVTFLLTFYFGLKAYDLNYDLKSMSKIFMISMVVSILIFLPSSLELVPFKLLIVLLYVSAVLRIVNINMKLVLGQARILCILRKKNRNV